VSSNSPKESPLNPEFLVRYPAGSQLVQDYVQGAAGADPFFVGSWRDAASFEEKAAEIDERFDREARVRAAAALRGAGELSDDRLEQFVEQRGFVVTTGQQPGLFTGPLYSVYKGLTAIHLAAELEDLLGRPVLPVFWVASEDHDWAEANHTFALGRDNELAKVEVADPEGHSRRPIHRIRLGGEVDAALGEFAEALPPTDFSGDLMDLLRSCYPDGCTLDQGFRATIDALLGPLGIMTTDAADETVKSVSRSLLLDALSRSEEHEAVLTTSAAALEAAGYTPQVTIMDGAVNVFLEGPAGRERLYRDGDDFRLHNSGDRLSLAEIESRLDQDAKLLSPNVLLRPVVESTVFPTLSYVGGPGELAYFGQLAPYFDLQGIRMPVVHPRVSVTVLEKKVGKVIDKLSVDPATLARPFHEVAAEFAREEVPTEVRAALGKLRGSVGQGIGELLDAARPIDPTLKGPIQAARNASFAAFNDAEKKILASIKRESEIALGQLEKAQKNLYPGGIPQERILNVFQYLVRYGRDLLGPLGERVRGLVRMKDVETTATD